MSRRVTSALVLLIALLAVSPAVMADCTWTETTSTTLPANCNVGIGTTATNTLTVFGANSRSQFKLANDSEAGILSVLGYSADNIGIGFDVDFDSGWKARNATVGWLYKTSGNLVIMGSGSNTSGGTPVQNDWVTVNLSNGATTFAGTSNGTSVINGGLVSLGGTSADRLSIQNATGSSIRFNNTGTMPGRVHTAIADWIGLTLNTRYNGSAWTRDNTAKPAWVMTMDGRSSQDALYVTRFNTSNVDVELLRLTANGDFAVAGNIAAKYQDVAEWVPATEQMSAGTVVVLNPDKTNEVMVSAAAYDTSVAGVVSERPGVLLGEAGLGKAMIATTGRVKVRVDASSRPVKVGDLLVTSDKPGVAMPSMPIEVGSVKIHRPGTIIGKALEPLAKGEGEILVLLSLQ